MALMVDSVQFNAKIDALKGSSQELRTEILGVASLRFIDLAIQNINKNGSIVTGKLKQSFDYKISHSGNSSSSTISPNAKSPEGVEYAYYVEYGRGPVFPINGKAIFIASPDGDSFNLKTGQKGFFRTSANAAPAKPFMGPALQSVSGEMPQIVSTVLEEYVRA